MKKDYTHICIILDASGSMSRIENDIKGSFNTFLNKQREEQVPPLRQINSSFIIYHLSFIIYHSLKKP